MTEPHEPEPGPDAADEGASPTQPQARPKQRSASLGSTVGGIMHGIDADIFRDPAAEHRMERDRKTVHRAADGTMVEIELPLLRDDGPGEPPDPVTG